MMDYTTGVAQLESRARMTIPVVWGFIAVGLLTACAEVLEAMALVDVEAGQGFLDLTAGFTYLAYAIALFASLVFVGMWIHRAHANLAFTGVQGLEYTPGWAIGWFFVPIANFFKPFSAMRELWNASHGAKDQFDADSPSVLKMWWAAWVTGNIISVISEQVISSGAVEQGLFISAGSTLVLVVAAVFLIRIIHGVTDAQLSGLSTSEVFA